MNSKRHVSILFFCLSLLAAGSASYGSGGIYTITKTGIYFQNSSSAATASLKYPYNFDAAAVISATLTLPGGSMQATAFDSNDSDYEISQSFATLAAMDAAYPDGTYQMTGSGIPTLSFTLTPDSYPSTVPSIVSNSTWNNGVFYVNPAASSTIDFNDFSAYGTVGLGSYMQMQIIDQVSGGPEIKQKLISVSNSFGIPMSSTPFTSYTIPASTLTPGDIYELDLQYSNILTFNTTAVPGSGLATFFSNVAIVFFVALPSSSTPPPVIASDLTNQTGLVGGSATMSLSATVGGSPIASGGTYTVLWYLNGQDINIDGVKYVYEGDSLLINSLTTADAGNYVARVINQGGMVLSAGAMLTVLPASASTPPTITGFSGTTGEVASGTAVNLSVTAAEAGLTLTYQWQLAGSNISGATSSTYALASAAAGNSGDYTVIVSNGYTTSTHDFGTLTVEAAGFPTFTLAASPAAVTVASGRSVAFNAIATGTPAPTYQWKLNGSTTIPGATGTTDPILLVSGATLADAGTYTCTATNSGGSNTTSATLSVITTSTPGYLVAISSRAVVGTGGNILIAGFAIGGSGSMDLLVRGVGPGLGNSLDLPAAQMTLFDTVIPNNPQPIVTNSGWSNASTLGTSTVNVHPLAATTTLMNSLGAFPITPGSADSALEVTPPVGDYTSQVSGVGGTSGIALAEIYDADAYSPTTRLVDISTRAFVSTGANILIGGVVIDGSTAETVLVRGVGPALTGFGTVGAIAQPVLTIYSGSNIIYSNTGWGDDSTISTAIGTVGAFPFGSASQDSALLVTLPPGAYTVQVGGVNNGTGIGLVEIYELY